jgi:hypothetical protein
LIFLNLFIGHFSEGFSVGQSDKNRANNPHKTTCLIGIVGRFFDEEFECFGKNPENLKIRNWFGWCLHCSFVV